MNRERKTPTSNWKTPEMMPRRSLHLPSRLGRMRRAVASWHPRRLLPSPTLTSIISSVGSRKPSSSRTSEQYFRGKFQRLRLQISGGRPACLSSVSGFFSILNSWITSFHPTTGTRQPAGVPPESSRAYAEYIAKVTSAQYERSMAKTNAMVDDMRAQFRVMVYALLRVNAPALWKQLGELEHVIILAAWPTREDSTAVELLLKGFLVSRTA